MINNKESAEKYAKQLFRDMLFAAEWSKIDLVQEKKNAKNCAIVAVKNIIDATTNFGEMGVTQNQFYIDVLYFLESYEP
jgi:hypothetical protein